MKEEILKKSIEILSDITGIDKADISEESTLIEDLGIESFDLADLNFKIKDEFKITMENDFLSLEGIVGNPNFVDEYNCLKKSGIEELTKRFKGISINKEILKEGVEVMKILNQIKIIDMVDFIIANK